MKLHIGNTSYERNTHDGCCNYFVTWMNHGYIQLYPITGEHSTNNDILRCMKKGYVLFTILTLIVTGAFSLITKTEALTAPYGFIFLYDMKQGTTLTDVQYLQEILNSDTRTMVTDTGFGSPGNETTYFGEKTKNAIIRFQELYAADIPYLIISVLELDS